MSSAVAAKNISFTAFLINGPGKDFEFWNSYIRFEYHINDLIKSPDYQPVIIGALLIFLSSSYDHLSPLCRLSE